MTFRLLTQVSAITGKAALWDDRRDCLWWVDIQAQRLLRTELDGTTVQYFTPSQPGMLALGESGRVVVGLEDGLWTFEPAHQEWAQIAQVEADRPTVRLNDGKVDERGRLWFGSMDMTHTGAALGRLYCRDTDGTIRVVREGLRTPNAIVPAAGRSGLWFVDSPTRCLEFIALHPYTGAMESVRTIATLPCDLVPDGACEDSEGYLWLSTVGRGAVLRLSPEGVVVEVHDTPLTRLTMTALGGLDMRTLFVTSQRRFLDVTELKRERWAGGLMCKQVDFAGRLPERMKDI